MRPPLENALLPEQSVNPDFRRARSPADWTGDRHSGPPWSFETSAEACRRQAFESLGMVVAIRIKLDIDRCRHCRGRPGPDRSGRRHDLGTPDNTSASQGSSHHVHYVVAAVERPRTKRLDFVSVACTPPPWACLQVLADAGDLDGAFEAAGALVTATPSSSPTPRVGGRNPAGTGIGGDSSGRILDLPAARMLCSLEDCSDRSLDLFEAIAARCVMASKKYGCACQHRARGRRCLRRRSEVFGGRASDK